MSNILELKRLHSIGFEIHIVSSAKNCEWIRNRINSFIKEHDLPISGIHLTQGEKGMKLAELDSFMHFDDQDQDFEDSLHVFKGKWILV